VDQTYAFFVIGAFAIAIAIYCLWSLCNSRFEKTLKEIEAIKQLIDHEHTATKIQVIDSQAKTTIDVEKAVARQPISQLVECELSVYHQDKLMPALQLLAAQNVPKEADCLRCAARELAEKEKPKSTLVRNKLDLDSPELKEIETKLAGMY
jgi:hypothetical protein